MSKKVSSRVKAHTRYRLKDGTIVPGVTTITSRQLGWNKKVLNNWHNKMGIDGIDTGKFVDDKAAIGTLAHAFCTDWLLDKDTETDDYTKNQIDMAQNCALSFFEWIKRHKVRPILIEAQLVSEKYRYGGQIDIYAEIDGALELVDLKTGKDIYPEHAVQAAGGYEPLLLEHGHMVERVWILNIPRAETESFQEKNISRKQRIVAQKLFRNCLRNHRLEKQLTGRGK